MTFGYEYLFMVAAGLCIAVGVVARFRARTSETRQGYLVPRLIWSGMGLTLSAVYAYVLVALSPQDRGTIDGDVVGTIIVLFSTMVGFAFATREVEALIRARRRRSGIRAGEGVA